jgi:hypothetical protein
MRITRAGHSLFKSAAYLRLYPNPTHSTPAGQLCLASQYGDVLKVQEMLALGVSPDTVSPDGYTSVHYAALRNRVRTLESSRPQDCAVFHCTVRACVVSSLALSSFFGEIGQPTPSFWATTCVVVCEQ